MGPSLEDNVDASASVAQLCDLGKLLLPFRITGCLVGKMKNKDTIPGTSGTPERRDVAAE